MDELGFSIVWESDWFILLRHLLVLTQFHFYSQITFPKNYQISDSHLMAMELILR
jgi:hypothetical protein